MVGVKRLLGTRLCSHYQPMIRVVWHRVSRRCSASIADISDRSPVDLVVLDALGDFLDGQTPAAMGARAHQRQLLGCSEEISHR